jgi:hypothetical protein
VSLIRYKYGHSGVAEDPIADTALRGGHKPYVRNVHFIRFRYLHLYEHKLYKYKVFAHCLKIPCICRLPFIYITETYENY